MSDKSKQERETGPSSKASDRKRTGDQKVPARKTIHPRITPIEMSDGIQLAQKRNDPVNSLWSTVVSNGLPITAALTPPDKNGMHGPWSGKELARKNRHLVDQLIAFQIHHGELPSTLELIQVIFQGQVTIAPLLKEETNEKQSTFLPTEIYDTEVDSNIVQDMAEQGFGVLNLEVDEEAT